MSAAPRPHDSGDRNLGPVFLVLTCVLTSFSVITTALRCWVRKANHAIGWDDYLIMAVTILAIARMALQVVSVRYGNGRHEVYLTETESRWVVMASWYTQIILFPSLSMLKVSICLLLLRIKNTPRTKIAMYIMIVGLVLTNGVPELVLLIECTPVKAYWTPSAGKCWPPTIRIYSIYVQVGYSILTDFVCSLMPVFLVYNIRISLKDKFSVCGLMGLGLVATACAAVRASSLSLGVSDLSYDYCTAAIWANTELHLGIIAANCACGRAIYNYFHSGSSASTRSSSHSHNVRRSVYLKSNRLSVISLEYPMIPPAVGTPESTPGSTPISEYRDNSPSYFEFLPAPNIDTELGFNGVFERRKEEV